MIFIFHCCGLVKVRGLNLACEWQYFSWDFWKNAELNFDLLLTLTYIESSPYSLLIRLSVCRLKLHIDLLPLHMCDDLIGSSMLTLLSSDVSICCNRMFYKENIFMRQQPCESIQLARDWLTLQFRFQTHGFGIHKLSHKCWGFTWYQHVVYCNEHIKLLTCLSVVLLNKNDTM